MTELDIRLFRLLHDPLGGGTLAWMAALTVVGGGWGALSLLPLFAVSRLRQLAVAFAATLGVNAVVVYALKSVVARPRPWHVLADVKPLIFAGPTDFSFPSGHAAGSFCYATFLAVLLVRTRSGLGPYVVGCVLLVLATGVALSRIALGVHFPGDVAAGALIGSSIGTLGAHLHIRKIRPRPVDEVERAPSEEGPVDPSGSR
jgi:undecaprenyl-diphosphatase